MSDLDTAKLRDRAESPLHSMEYRPPSRKETLALLDRLAVAEDLIEHASSLLPVGDDTAEFDRDYRAYKGDSDA